MHPTHSPSRRTDENGKVLSDATDLNALLAAILGDAAQAPQPRSPVAADETAKANEAPTPPPVEAVVDVSSPAGGVPPEATPSATPAAETTPRQELSTESLAAILEPLEDPERTPTESLDDFVMEERSKAERRVIFFPTAPESVEEAPPAVEPAATAVDGPPTPRRRSFRAITWGLAILLAAVTLATLTALAKRSPDAETRPSEATVPPPTAPEPAAPSTSVGSPASAGGSSERPAAAAGAAAPAASPVAPPAADRDRAARPAAATPRPTAAATRESRSTTRPNSPPNRAASGPTEGPNSRETVQSASGTSAVDNTPPPQADSPERAITPPPATVPTRPESTARRDESLEPPPAAPVRSETREPAASPRREPAPAAASPSSASSTAPPAGARNVNPARLLSSISPEYPRELLNAKIGGTVSLKLQIDARGRVTSAEATDGPEQLRPAAQRAVRAWRYAPATIDGVAVPGEAAVKVVFDPAAVRRQE